MPLLFAYGALLDPAVLSRRAVALTAPPAPALAPAHAVAFAHRGGYATLVGATDPRVHAWRRGAGAACVSPAPARGALLALATDADVAALEVREGGYKLVKVPVTAADRGGEVTALAFVSRAGLMMLNGPAPPRAAYAARVRAGAAALDLDTEWRAWLDGVPTLADGGPLPVGYNDTGAGRAAAAAAAAALVGVGVVAAVGGQG